MADNTKRRKHWRDGKTRVCGPLVPEDAGSAESLDRMCQAFGQAWRMAHAAYSPGTVRVAAELDGAKGVLREIRRDGAHYGRMAAAAEHSGKCRYPDHGADWAAQRCRVRSAYAKRDGASWLLGDAMATGPEIDPSLAFWSVEVSRVGDGWQLAAYVAPRRERAARATVPYAERKRRRMVQRAAEWLAQNPVPGLTVETLAAAGGYMAAKTQRQPAGAPRDSVPMAT